jgi:hypothetical protein
MRGVEPHFSSDRSRPDPVANDGPALFAAVPGNPCRYSAPMVIRLEVS